MMVCGKNCLGVSEIITNKQSYSMFGKYIIDENHVNTDERINSGEEANEQNTFSCILTYPNENIEIENYVNLEKFES